MKRPPWQSAITPSSRFWLKVWPRGDCWEWRGHRNKDGYGVFNWTRSEPLQAHRVAFQLVRGLLPAAQPLDHLCRHRWCVRPSHLELVTVRINTLRGETLPAFNARKTHCRRGHPFDALNTLHRRDGSRQCRACHTDYMRKYRRVA